MTQEQVGAIIRQFRVTLSQLQLYAASSNLVQDASKQLLTLMEEAWREAPEILFAESERQLLVNGVRFPWKGADAVASEALASRLLTHHVKSVGFKTGLTSEELLTLIELLARKPGSGDDAFVAQVASKGLSHVVLNEKVFVVAGEVVTPPESPPPSTPEALKNKTITLTAEDAKKLKSVLETKPSQKISTIDAAKELLTQQADTFLVEETVKQLPDMIRQLDKMEQAQLAEDVVDKLATNFDSTDADIRLRTARSFKSVTPAVEALSDKRVNEKLENRFTEAGELESSKPVYTELADLLERGADRVLGEGNYEKTIRIVGMFRRHTEEKDAGFIDRWTCAQKALERIANRSAIEILVSDLRAEDASRRDQAYTVVMKLASAAIGELIDTIQETEDPHLRRVVTYAIKNIGEDAVKTYVSSIPQATSPEGGKRLVEALEGLGQQDGMPADLVKVFPQCQYLVKIEILRLLTRMRVAEAQALIVQAMDDGDRRVRLASIELAGKFQAKSAVAKLLPLIVHQSRFTRVDEDDEVQEMSCRALGLIGEPQSLATLVEIASPASFMKRTKSDPVRTAAILALGEFTHEEGKRAVDALLQAKEPAMKQAAEQAKKRQETKVKKKGDRLAATVL